MLTAHWLYWGAAILGTFAPGDKGGESFTESNDHDEEAAGEATSVQRRKSTMMLMSSRMQGAVTSASLAQCYAMTAQSSLPEDEPLIGKSPGESANPSAVEKLRNSMDTTSDTGACAGPGRSSAKAAKPKRKATISSWAADEASVHRAKQLRQDSQAADAALQAEAKEITAYISKKLSEKKEEDQYIAAVDGMFAQDGAYLICNKPCPPAHWDA